MTPPPPLRFCFALHLHQPWGNFGSVFEQHLTEVYRPLLRTMIAGEFHPVAVHLSGPLLEWMDEHAPDFLDELGEQAAAGHVELLCGGHDEPILAVLPRQDRIDQVLRHRQWIHHRFGIDSTGLWLTERVWEPSLPLELAAAGVDFTLVDDRHFRVSGFAPDELHAHYVTEDGGSQLHLFPIDEKLRYLIPFRPPDELAGYLRGLRSAGHHLAILGDDGEKFGGWPGTLTWLYRDGWFNDFLETMRRLRDDGDVELCRFDVALAATPSRGLAYLPSASYREMEGWSLPVEPARALLRLEQAWAPARLDGVEGGLLRGGHWRHFLVKYPESNRMHKLMVALSVLCREHGNPTEARRAIGRAQCNDAYWHGVFGGLYLPFLRQQVWSNLAVAEALLRQGAAPAVDWSDVDGDGADDLWAHFPRDSVLLLPAQGGLIAAWLDLAAPRNLLNVIARHPEAYHRPLAADTPAAAETPPDTGGAPSIHDLESQLGQPPPFDRESRGLFVDRVIPGDSTRDDFVAGRVRAHRSWAAQPMSCDWHLDGNALDVRLTADDLSKTVRIAAGEDTTTITARWQWDPARFPASSRFATELSVSDPVTIDAPGADRWEYAIETVAKSERGFDRTSQGTAIVLAWPIERGEAEVTVSRTAPGAAPA
ncbi:MAG: alpha-amylase/4-alpha-glucanotransferase domain-containing protein [Gemmatimonadales bacterium]